MTAGKMIRWAVRFLIWGWVGYALAGIWLRDLGASPAVELNHQMGEITLVLLTANLVLGMVLDVWRPLPRILRLWVSERRFWGVSAFLVLVLHVFFYLLEQGFEMQGLTQMVTKLYLIFGTLAFLILLMLALTSNDWSVRKLRGKLWKRLHRAVYLAQSFILAHVMLIEKTDLLKYGVWIGGLLILQGARGCWHVIRSRKNA